MAAMKTLVLLLTLVSGLGGCAMMTSVSENYPTTLYDTLVLDSTDGSTLTPATLARKLARADVVVIGEYHGHQGSHLLQSRVQQELFRLRPAQVLTMEQFNLDHQQDLDRYLQGQSGEAEMIEDADAWANYRGSYRPLVEFARTHNTPVIAANAPAGIVRCVGRKGPDYLDQLPGDMRAQLPDEPFLDTGAYRAKFVEAITGSHGSGDPTLNERMNNSYKAQLLRDNTMASRILEARKHSPEAQILHLTGTFHSEEGLGTVALLKQRAPELSVVVVSPVFWPPGEAEPPLENNRSKGDYLYFVQPLPEEFLDPEREQAAMKARFSRAADTDCN